MNEEQRVHFVKCWPVYFEPLRLGLKTGELRKNDRNYQVGDLLVNQEWSPTKQAYTGRECRHLITHIVADTEHLTPGYVMLSLREV